MHILLLTITLLFTGLFQQTDDINYTYKVHDLRHLFERGAKDREACEKLLNHLNEYKGKDPVVWGFRAATHGVMAKHAWSPYYKVKYLRTADTMFEEVMKQHPHVAEVHFLRYTLEYYIPRYLNMSNHLETDRAVFMKSIMEYPKSDIDLEALQIMRRFLLKHPDHLTEQEKKYLTNLKV